MQAMWWPLVFSVIIAVVHARATANDDDHFWNSLISKINSAGSTWKADRNFHRDFTPETLNRLLGAKLDEEYEGPVKTIDDFARSDPIPSEFDSRKKWPYCSSISHIRDQGYCGSCWAVSASSVLSDRFCVASEGKHTAELSMEDLLSCCNDCGHGCEGGHLSKAWNFFMTEGVVTGGVYESHLGCQPYSLNPCEHHMNGSRPQCFNFGELPTPSCRKRCTNSRHHNKYEDDHHKVNAYYRLSGEESIQREIIDHGPVQAGFTVYEDFLAYKSGIYQHVTGALEGGHAVKIIGWGVESGTPYWIIANSWNSDWGENGYFRMLRGKNECQIEEAIYGGKPVMKTSDVD